MEPKSLKIAFFVTEFPSVTETFITNQVISLKKEGHLVHIFSQFKPTSNIVHQSVIENNLVTCTFYIGNVNGSRTQKIIRLIRTVLRNPFSRRLFMLLKAVKSNSSTLSVYEYIKYSDKPDYDVLHAHFGENGNYVTNLRKLGLFHEAKFVTTFHGYDLEKNSLQVGFYNSLIDHCHLYTINSSFSKKKLAALYNKVENTYILPVGLDTDTFRPVEKEQFRTNSVKILFVGRLVPFKAPNKVVEISKILKERTAIKFQTIIAGEGPLRENLEEMVLNYGLKNNVILKGVLNQEQVRSLMNESDIFLYPGITVDGRAENQGLVLQEAQAMELPVLVSDAGGMKEGMIDGETGFVIPENDLDAFVEKIEFLAKNESKRREMGKAGRQLAVQRYDSRYLGEQLIKLYQQ